MRQLVLAAALLLVTPAAAKRPPAAGAQGTGAIYNSSPSVVQTKENSSAASATTLASGALTTNPVTGSILWAVVRAQTNVTISVADTLGLTWTSRGSVIEAGTGVKLEAFTAPVPAGGACDVTATYGAATTNRGILVVEVGAVAAFQGSDAQQDSGNNPTTSCTVSVTAQPAFGLMVGNDLQGGTPGVGTGWTDGGLFWATIGNLRLQTKAITSTGSVSGNFVNPWLDRYVEAMAVFTD